MAAGLPEVFNRVEGAKRIGQSQRTFDELLALGEIKSMKIGGRRFVTSDALADFLKRAAQKPIRVRTFKKKETKGAVKDHDEKISSRGQ